MPKFSSTPASPAASTHLTSSWATSGRQRAGQRPNCDGGELALGQDLMNYAVGKATTTAGRKSSVLTDAWLPRPASRPSTSPVRGRRARRSWVPGNHPRDPEHLRRHDQHYSMPTASPHPRSRRRGCSRRRAGGQMRRRGETNSRPSACAPSRFGEREVRDVKGAPAPAARHRHEPLNRSRRRAGSEASTSSCASTVAEDAKGATGDDKLSAATAYEVIACCQWRTCYLADGTPSASSSTPGRSFPNEH